MRIRISIEFALAHFVVIALCGCSNHNIKEKIKNDQRKVSMLVFEKITNDGNIDSRVLDWNWWVLRRLEKDKDQGRLIIFAGKDRYESWVKAGRILDPYGQPYLISVANNEDELLIEIRSTGRDKKINTADDLLHSDQFEFIFGK